MKKKNSKILRTLFLSTLYLSTFTFGGGYVIVSLMKKDFVDARHWIDEEEMLDLVAIAQSAPGAIAVGYKLAGILGAFVAIFGTVIPPFVIISILSVCYQAFRSNLLVARMLEGMQAGVGAVIASVTFGMGCSVIKEKDVISVLVLILSFLLACSGKINIVWIILGCGILGVIRTMLERKVRK